VPKYQVELLRFIESNHADLLEGLRTGKKELTKELEEKLKKALEAFAGVFQE
jgi:F0F1-type ATP synthase alpha subunit